MFKILLVTATDAELEKLRSYSGIKLFNDGFNFLHFEIHTLVTGVGSVATVWSMAKWLQKNKKPDLCINIGIAGSYNDGIRIGEVVLPVTDCFADAGVEDGENFLTLHEAGLSGPDNYPFSNGKLIAGGKYITALNGLLKPVNAVTLNTASGSAATINRIVHKYNPDIETMEGATFFYICSREMIPFLALRAISNKVEIRNKCNWNIPLALENLSEKFFDVILRLD